MNKNVKRPKAMLDTNIPYLTTDVRILDNNWIVKICSSSICTNIYKYGAFRKKSFVS